MPNIGFTKWELLCCLIYWANAIDGQNTIVSDFKSLLHQYPMVDVAAMGFPADWRNEPIWQ